MGVALVTGASGGIGSAVAKELAAAGFTVVLTARRREALEAVADAVHGSGGRASVHPADVTVPSEVAALFDHIASEFGRLDVLFNNAGATGSSMPIPEVSPEDWAALIAANLTSVFLCSARAFELMSKQEPAGGRIINNGSVAAQVPRPLSAPYTAAKHGVTGLTKATALEGRRYGIVCGQIDIGNADTTLTRQISTGVLQPDGERRAEPTFDVAHVARLVCDMACLPLDTNVLHLTMIATTMPFVGRG